MFLRLSHIIAVISVFLFGYIPSAGAQNYEFVQNSDGSYQDDFVVQKICVPNTAGVQLTPVQCTSDKGKLRDVTSTDVVGYIHADYPAAAAKDLPVVGSATIPLSTCRSYFGDLWIYDFPLSAVGSLHLNGTDSLGSHYPLYVHWIAAALHEYSASGGSNPDCSLSNDSEYAYDSFGILTEFSYSSAIYMTLLGEDLPCSYGTQDDNTSPVACITTHAEPETECSSWTACPRQYGWSIGINSDNNWGIQNYHNAWASDLSLGYSGPAFNTIDLAKKSLYYNETLDGCKTGAASCASCPIGAASCTTCTGYGADGCQLPAAAQSGALFGQNNVSDFTTANPVPQVSFSVQSDFTFGPSGDYDTTNTQFQTETQNNVNPASGATLSPTLPSILQFGYVHMYNGDAPAPYSGPGADAAGESEHIYSTQLYGYSTRWELWHEVDLRPTAIVEAATVYDGNSCSHPENPYRSKSGVVNNDFYYGDAEAVLVPVAWDGASSRVISQPGANVAVGTNGLAILPTPYAKIPSPIIVAGSNGQPTTVTNAPSTPGTTGTPYANSSIIITTNGILSFGSTPTDSLHYPVYWWPKDTTNFSNPPASYQTNHGGTLMAVGSVQGVTAVLLNAGGNATEQGNWYQWVPGPDASAIPPGSWQQILTGISFPAKESVVAYPAWEEPLTAGPAASPTTNIWYLAGCKDYTNAWNSNDMGQYSLTKWTETLPNYPGTVHGAGNSDFAHVIGSNYLTYFGVTAFP